MNLKLKPEVAAGYRSLSQQARVLTEMWVLENLYCPACPWDILSQAPKGEKVVDFTCEECGEPYQLKSHRRPFVDRVVNSAYQPKFDAISRGTIPNFVFLQYDPMVWKVQNLFVVPKHFISLSMIERRKPLSESARRSGWVGSSILLGNLPADARIPIVEAGREISSVMVRTSWSRFIFLRGQSARFRGWLADVLACVRKLDRETFTLAEVYVFRDHLARLHPENKNIRPKIRQQLQILRDNGIIEFLGKGNYRIYRSY